MVICRPHAMHALPVIPPSLPPPAFRPSPSSHLIIPPFYLFICLFSFLPLPLLPPPPSQPGESGDLEGAQPVFERYLVELSAITSSGQDLIGNEMRMFADQLKPYPSYNPQDEHRARE